MKQLLIDLATLPEEGKTFTGELSTEIFDLPKGDAQPAGPLEFDLRVQRFGSELLFTGYLRAPFEFTCVRTLHPFIQTIEVSNAAVSLEIKDATVIDATEALREEVLIHFPTDPRCDDADEPQQCEIDPRYLAVDKPGEDAVETPPHAEGDDRWSALDAIKNTDSDR
ncbi:MAG: YceD family protein [Verrucomicrobiales bacterium]